MKRRPWTTTEEAALRDLYPTHTARDIAAQLGRGISAVYQRAHDLGLKKTSDWIAEQIVIELEQAGIKEAA